MQQIRRLDANLLTNYRDKKQIIGKPLLVNSASSRGVAANLRKLSNLADETLKTLWRRANMPADFALLAVGGFGRAQLFPHSDIDVLLLLPDHAKPETDALLTQKIESFISSCWDSGLEIGSSVRNVADCVAQAAGDVTVQTSLLESRLIVGNKGLYATFLDAFRDNLDPKAFFVAKTLEMRQRHQKFENTPYSLEPNCKESPGGLRDLQIILWVANAANLGKNWDDLAKNGLATPFEVKQIKSNEATLNLIRARLHSLAQRREDRLVFDLQTVVAESFNYKNDSSKSNSRASEQLMRRYYWAAKAVTQLT
ncbi:MAG: bifunctional uridylyltransferase/uridylyl-removing protein, partial [Candidatus Cloacimonetes bacterium]|nr:bifunctional uridylyltransferase/uridylyl-removing protein [Candidatus Cloacimonadota bacterium]